MSERINKTYKPSELEAAINALYESSKLSFNYDEVRETIKELHSRGWRLVKT